MDYGQLKTLLSAIETANDSADKARWSIELCVLLLENAQLNAQILAALQTKGELFAAMIRARTIGLWGQSHLKALFDGLEPRHQKPELAQKIAEIDEETKRYTSQIEALEALERTLKAKTPDLEAKKQQCDTLQHTIARYEEIVARCSPEYMHELEQRAKTLEAEGRTLEEREANCHGIVEKIQTSRQQIERNKSVGIQTISQELERLKALLPPQIARIIGDCDSKHEELRSYELTYSENARKLETMQEQITKLRADFEEQKRLLDAHYQSNTQVEANNLKLKELEKNIAKSLREYDDILRTIIAADDALREQTNKRNKVHP